MNQNELRLGNIVTINNVKHRPNESGNLFLVVGISYSNIRISSGTYDFGQLPDFIVPIKLTEDWLVKFGFKRVSCGIGWDEISNGIVQLNEVPTNKGKLIAFNYATDKYNYLKYVHQLQNLYFILCGVELQLSST